MKIIITWFPMVLLGALICLLPFKKNEDARFAISIVLSLMYIEAIVEIFIIFKRLVFNRPEISKEDRELFRNSKS